MAYTAENPLMEHRMKFNIFLGFSLLSHIVTCSHGGMYNGLFTAGFIDVMSTLQRGCNQERNLRGYGDRAPPNLKICRIAGQKR